MGAVLYQQQGGKLGVIAYESRKFTPAERNYSTADQETLAVIHALKKWRHYLEGAVGVEIYTDHQPLVHLRTQPTLSRRHARWILYLDSFQPTISYKPGKANVVADALSRRPDMRINAISSVSLEPEMVLEIKKALDQDKMLAEMGEKLTHHGSGYTQKDGLLYHLDKLYIPDSMDLRRRIMAEHHDTKIAGHLGRDKTLELVQRRFYWPGMQHDIKIYVRTCPSCQRTKPSNRLPAGLLQPLPVPNSRWEEITMDLITMLPKTPRGFDAVIVFVDRLTKMAHFAPTTTGVTAPELAKIFMNTVFKLHGMPKIIISDRDSKFTSNFWRSFTKLMDTKLGLSTAYHPQTDGQSERMNRTLEQMLRAFCGEKQHEWDEHLALAEFAYNNSCQASTGYSPFHLNYGEEPKTPVVLLHPTKRNDSWNPASADWINNLQADMTKAKRQLAQARDRQAANANKRRRHDEFKIGQKVLLSTAHLTMDFHQKFKPKWCGPYKVLDKIGAVAYKLELPPQMHIHPVFHISMLKPFEGDRQDEDRPPPVVTIQGKPAWEVESILDKQSKGKKTKYLVKWKGYPVWESTWEPVGMLNAPIVKKMIARFESQTTGTLSSEGGSNVEVARC
jgi:hypothetical protein